MTLTPYQQETPREWIALMPSAVELAKAVANTEFVPTSLRGNPAAITAAILYGDEVGLGPMQSLAKISVIEGRPTLAAEAQRALILAAGHDLWMEDATITRVTLAGKRSNSDQTTRVTWTMDDAKRAGIAGKRNWRTYPRQMLLARATAELARAIFADAIGGLAATEELEGDEPETSTQKRRRTPLTAVSTTDEPGPSHSEAGSGLAEAPEPSAVEAPTGEEAGLGAPEAPPPPVDEEIERLQAMGVDVQPRMTDAQRKKMMAAFNERGFTERSARLAFTTVVVGRMVSSANELSVEEASRVIDVLETGHMTPEEPAGEDAILQEAQEVADETGGHIEEAT